MTVLISSLLIERSCIYIKIRHYKSVKHHLKLQICTLVNIVFQYVKFGLPMYLLFCRVEVMIMRFFLLFCHLDVQGCLQFGKHDNYSLWPLDSTIKNLEFYACNKTTSKSFVPAVCHRHLLFRQRFYYDIQTSEQLVN